jgi:hypothetical protein
MTVTRKIPELPSSPERSFRACCAVCADVAKRAQLRVLPARRQKVAPRATTRHKSKEHKDMPQACIVFYWHGNEQNRHCRRGG